MEFRTEKQTKTLPHPRAFLKGFPKLSHLKCYQANNAEKYGSSVKAEVTMMPLLKEKT